MQVWKFLARVDLTQRWQFCEVVRLIALHSDSAAMADAEAAGAGLPSLRDIIAVSVHLLIATKT